MSPQALQGMNEVAERLGRLRSSMRGLFLLDGISRLLLALGGFVLFTFVLDYSFWLPVYVRIPLLLLGLSFFAWVIARYVVYPMGVPISDDDLALFVERHYPELSDRLISAIQLSRSIPLVPTGDAEARGVSYNSPELVDALIADAQQATSSLDFNRVIIADQVQTIGLWAGGLTIVLAALGAWQSNYAAIYLKRLFGGSQKWPQRIHLDVLDFDPVTRKRIISKGEDLVIAVQATRVNPTVAMPDRVELEFKYKTGETGKVRLEPAVNDQFKTPMESFSRLSGDFSFTVSGGDDETDEYYVETLTPPSIEEIHVFYEFPKYLRLPDTPDTQPVLVGNVSAPLRTRVRFEADSNEELSEASMSLGVKGKEEVFPLKISPTRDKGKLARISGDFVIREAHSEWSLSLTAKNGLKNRDPIRYTILGKEDQAPKISAIDPLSDEDVTEICVRPIEFDVEDDYGIAEIAIEYRILGTARSTDWQVVKLGREQLGGKDYGEKKLRASYELDLAKLKVVPTDTVEVRFRASDYKDYAPLNISTGKLISLRVKTMTEIDAMLQKDIDTVKQNLEKQRTREEKAYQTSERFDRELGSLEKISADQQNKIRGAALEQNDIVHKLDSARKDLTRIMRRGVYNKIYDERAAEKLKLAIDILSTLVGEPNDPNKRGMATLASAQLMEASSSAQAKLRSDHLREAGNLQSQTMEGIKKALDALEKWSNYQEVVRMTREILDIQKRINNQIPGLKPDK